MYQTVKINQLKDQVSALEKKLERASSTQATKKGAAKKTQDDDSSDESSAEHQRIMRQYLQKWRKNIRKNSL